jgi:polyhydroxybutyrate depolymerase
VPPRLDRAKPAPLVVFLHGYGARSGLSNAQGLGIDAFADEAGFVLALPDGTVDSRGNHFWNATDACCGFAGPAVDDVAYVAWLLDDVAAKVAVDPARVYVVGHSNGGFFAHRLACDLAPRVAAAVSIAGATWKDPSRCAPAVPVSVLQIHGDADDTIRPSGGRVFNLPVPEYPSLEATMKTWAAKDACGATPHATGPAFDFDDRVPGAETTRVTYGPCKGGASVDLWTVGGGSHFPHPSREGLRTAWAWLEAHARR